MSDDPSTQARPERIVMTFARIENDEKYLSGLWLEVSRTQAAIQRAVAAVEESRALLDRLATDILPVGPLDRLRQSPK